MIVSLQRVSSEFQEFKKRINHECFEEIIFFTKSVNREHRQDHWPAGYDHYLFLYIIHCSGSLATGQFAEIAGCPAHAFRRPAGQRFPLKNLA